ncbi:MAG TPA: hypothetical protein VGF67_04210 [Ktedonobacteraceae bacterium]|jgi:hypothetical protein
MHCVRFSWNEQTHQQRQQDFTRSFQDFVESIYAKDPARLLSDLKLPPTAEGALFELLDELHQTSHDYYRKHRGESRPHITRNILYDQFVTTRGSPAERIYDKSKPFAREIKQLLDLLYNAHQADVFGGYLLTPIDSPDRRILQEWNPQQFQAARQFDAEALITMLRGSAFSLVQEGLYLRSMDLLTLQDILDIRSTQTWQTYISSLEELLAKPVLFSTLAESVYTHYIALAQEMTHLIELRQRREGSLLVAPWEPSVKMQIEVGSASQDVIWKRDGTFHLKPPEESTVSSVLGSSDGSAPVTVRWTIGDSAAHRAGTQARLFSRIDHRGPDAQQPCPIVASARAIVCKTERRHMSEEAWAKPAYAIGTQGPRHWDIRANGISMEDLLAAYALLHGQPLQRLGWLTAGHAGLGTTYIYGIHPNASPSALYDGVWKHERLGGGSVIVPYAVEPAGGQIYVGLLRQWRKLHNTEQPVPGVPRGFTLAYEPVEGSSCPLNRPEVEALHIRTACTELEEEMFSGGVAPDMLQRLGPPVNTNNADVDTSGEGEGIYVYGVKLPWSSLTITAAGPLTLREEFFSRQGIAEGITHCQFSRLAEVLEMLDDPANPLAGCALTEIAIARLARYLQRTGCQIL